MSVIKPIPQQNCNECRFATKCYSKKTSPRNVVINILACRIKKDINRNESTRLLLGMLRPSLQKLANNALMMVGPNYINVGDTIADLESRVIECLLDNENGYQIGGVAYLTEYLFGTNPRTGWVKKWILWNFSKNKRFNNRHIIANDSNDTENEFLEGGQHLYKEPESIEDTYSNNQLFKSVMKIIDDGITLNSNEHRVLSFCLTHANESNKIRLVDGTHTYLSTVMGVSRPRITRLFHTSKTKILKIAAKHGLSL